MVIHNITRPSPQIGLPRFFGRGLVAFFLLANLVAFNVANDAQILLLIVALNLLGLIVYLLLRRTVMLPLRRILDLVHHLEMAEKEASARRHHLSFQDAIYDVHLRLQTLLTAYRQHQKIEHQLTEAHRALTHFHAEQEIITQATSSEITQQYRAILAYAHYLEERIAHRSADPSLREDYDEVCEQAFNLQLIVQAMGVLGTTRQETAALSRLSLSERIISLILDLTPSLDKRAMKLTTLAWDETVHAKSHSEVLTLTLWMLLLGGIRFAEDESTLTLGCREQGGRAVMEITISFLSPAALTESERLAYLEEKLSRGGRDASMFAQVLKSHGNIQLARLLAGRIEGDIAITPLTSYSCCITLTLPRA